MDPPPSGFLCRRGDHKCYNLHTQAVPTARQNQSEEFNKFESVVAISDDMALGSNFLFGFRGFDSDWDLFVDNITMTPILV